MLNNREVVSDKDVGHIKFILKIFKKVDHLCLNRNIESRYWFVRNDQLWLERNCSCNADTLTLSARKLVRIAVDVLWIKTHTCHEALYLCLDATFGFDSLNFKCCADERTDCLTRVKRCKRILEDHLHLRTQWLHLFRLEVCDVLAFEGDLSASWLVQLQNSATSCGLATT